MKYKREVTVARGHWVEGKLAMRLETVVVSGDKKWAVERAARYIGLSAKDHEVLHRHGMVQKLADAAAKPGEQNAD